MAEQRENKFSTTLKALRASRKLTQSELADIIGKDRSLVANYENGNRFPSLNVLIEMADFFQVSLHYLILGREKLPGVGNKRLPKQSRKQGQAHISRLKKAIKDKEEEAEVLKEYAASLKKYGAFLKKKLKKQEYSHTTRQ